MVIVENSPVDTGLLEGMIKDPEDLRLVWPKALYPFDHGQWEKIRVGPRCAVEHRLVDRGQRVILGGVDQGHPQHEQQDETAPHAQA